MRLLIHSKHIICIALCITLCVSLSSCKNEQSHSSIPKGKEKASSKPGSGGKTCEIIVVSPRAQYDNGVSQTIKDFFMAPQEGLNQSEPLFTVANIQPEAFKDNKMFMRHRNIIKVDINSKNEEPSISMHTDLWASPQAVFLFKAGNIQEFDSLFNYSKDFILKSIYEKEYLRIQRVFKKTENTDITEKLRKNYGFSMAFPEGFQIASMKSNFVWIRKESKHSGQGIIISTSPYNNYSAFELDQIIKKRNTITANVPGPAKGSFMTTETSYPEFYPSSKQIEFNGSYAIETRGLWKLDGDFMGGPFVNYVFVDTNSNRLIMLDAYLYSPRKPKRDLLMQMESIAKSFYLLEKQQDSTNTL